MRTNGMYLTVALAMLGLAAIMAVAGTVLAETHDWDTAEELLGGDFESTAWDGTGISEFGVTLSGRDSLWKYRGNPILSKEGSSAWDDGGVYEPCVVFTKGKYHLFYVGNTGSTYSIGLATSTDGKAFAKSGSNPVLTKNATGGSPDYSQVRDPYVIYEDGLFKMWYTGIDNSGVSSICYATSTTGTSWKKYASNPVISEPGSGWGASGIGDPCVVKIDGKYYMYLSGLNSLSEDLVGLATSTDGVSWTLWSSNPVVRKAPAGAFGQMDVADAAVYQDGPVLRMYFSGRNLGSERRRLGSASSYNGVDWTLNPNVEMDIFGSAWDNNRIQSPAVVRGGEGVYLYFSGDDGGGTPNYQLGMAQLKPWYVKHTSNPLLGTGLPFDAIELTDPCVVHNPSSGVYSVFYGCYGGVSYPDSIAMATATSFPISWSKYSSSTVLAGTASTWDASGVQDPCVLYENGTYKMWYSGVSGGKWQIGYAWTSATSGAGVFSKHGDNPIFQVGPAGAWDDAGVKMPWVVKVGSTYHMWYVGSSALGGTHIGHATSADGRNWTRDPANPVLRTDPSVGWESARVEQPCVLNVNGRFLMLYTGVKGSNYEVGMAWSDDGVTWVRDARSPIIPRGNDTKWDDDGTSMGSVLVEGSFMYAFFSGYNGSAWQVGVGRLYSDNRGIYTTPPFDASEAWPVKWGTLSWDADVPVGTSVRFQVATNRGGSLWRFVGPDGTASTYYESSGQNIFEFQSGSRVRVRAFLQSDDERKWVPHVMSITVSYNQRPRGPPTVVVTSPNGGEDWMKTKTYPITWVATGNLNATSVFLEYSLNNGTSWTSIATGQPNTGFYKWTVPSTETSGALVRVSVYDIDFEFAADTSDATFAIDPPAPKSGAFASPSAGESLAPGAHVARWTVNDPWGLADRPLTLELTTDGGLSWQLLADGLSLTDSLEWEVPDLAASSQGCRLRLSVLSWLGDISVIESPDFAIDVAAPSVDVVPPEGTLRAGSEVVVLLEVEDDLAVRSVTLHVAAPDGSGERSYAASLTAEGWAASFVPQEGEWALWGEASDGAHSSRGSQTTIDVEKAVAADGGSAGASTLSLQIVAAAALAVFVTAVVVLVRTRGRGR